MEKEIGSYILSKRTDYSKLQIKDMDGKNISNSSIGKKILDDYNLCIKNIDKYFEIDEDELFAYNNDPNLENIFIPENISKIGKYAFEKCCAKRIHIPKTTTFIDTAAFFKSENLEEICLPDTIKTISASGTFIDCKSLRTVYLPHFLENIPPSMFCRCYLLNNLILPDTLRHIGSCAFDNCASLQTLILPDSITTIEEDAFANCSQLTKINMPKSLTSIGIRVFAGSSIDTLIFNHTFKDVYFHESSVLKYSNVENIVIKDNVEYIDPAFFLPVQRYIKKIDFTGSDKQFKKFKKNNEKLFTSLPNAKINILNENLDSKTLPEKRETKDIFKSFVDR